MPKYCFNWSINGSTVIEADDEHKARAAWDQIQTLKDTLASASQTDFTEHEMLVETAPGIFEADPDPSPPDPGSDNPDCVHEWARRWVWHNGAWQVKALASPPAGLRRRRAGRGPLLLHFLQR